MQEILYDLNRSRGVIGSLLVSPDGMLIASDFKVEMDQELIAAMAASLINTMQKSIQSINEDSLTQAFIEASNGNIFLLDVGVGILALITEKKSNVGLIRLEMKSAAHRISQWMK